MVTPAFSVTAVTVGTQLTLPSGALLTVNPDGTFSYDSKHLFDYLPAPGSGAFNLTVTDTFSYSITGGDTATVTVTIGGVDSDDVLLDSPGIDSLAGGIGNDLYYVNNTGDAVVEAAGAGFDTVHGTTVDAMTDEDRNKDFGLCSKPMKTPPSQPRHRPKTGQTLGSLCIAGATAAPPPSSKRRSMRLGCNRDVQVDD